jgi:ABC-2 type transport system permease protein
MRLIGAELLKIRTTSTWWIFSLILLPLWALAVLYNWGTANITRGIDTTDADVPADQAELVRVTGEAVNVAATLYTSGQFLGVLLVMLLGAIIVTNEFFHLTATTTFLTTPHR